MLLEQQYLMLLLLEAREDGIIKRFVPEIVKKGDGLLNMSNHVINLVKPYLPAQMVDDAGPDTPKSRDIQIQERWSEAIIRFIVENDPDPKKTYATWMTLMFVRGLFNLEDMPRLVAAITIYGSAKQAGHISRSHDLMTVKTLDAFYDLVAPFRQTGKGEIVDQSVEMAMRKKSKILLDTPEYFVVSPLTKEAAQWFGRDTDWCTAYGGKYSVNHKDQTSLYSSYSNHPLYIIEVKATDEIFQFSFEHGQYMDRKDRSIQLNEFMAQHMTVCRAIGIEKFAHMIGRQGITLEFFHPQDLAGMDADMLAKGVDTVADLAKIPVAKLSDVKLLTTIVHRFGNNIRNFTQMPKLPGGMMMHKDFASDESKAAIKPLLKILMGHLTKEQFIEGLAKGGGQPLFAGLPADYRTDDLKVILARHTDYEDIEKFIPKPWPDSISKSYFESAADAGALRPEDVDKKFLSDDVLADTLVFHAESMPRFLDRITPGVARRLVAKTTGAHWQYISSVMQQLPKKYLTQELAVELYKQARTDGHREDDMLRALTFFDFSLWPWKNGKMVRQMGLYWKGTFDELPPRLQTEEYAKEFVIARWDGLGKLSKKWITPEIIEAALIETIKERSKYIGDKIQIINAFSSVLNQCDPKVLNPELLAGVIMAKINRTDFPAVWDKTPEKFRTPDFAKILAEHGALPFDSQWFPKDAFNPQGIAARVKTMMPSLNSEYTTEYNQHYAPERKTAATLRFVASIRQLWNSIPQAYRTPQNLALVAKESPEILLGADKSILTSEVMDSWIQGEADYMRSGGYGSYRRTASILYPESEIFKLFPKSAYTSFNMAMAVKRNFIKKVPDDLVDDDVLVSLVKKRADSGANIDWKKITPEIFARAAQDDDGVVYLKPPISIVSSPLVAQAIFKKAKDRSYYGIDRVREFFIKPEARANWDQSLYNDAVALGVVKINEVPAEFQNDSVRLAGVIKIPETILNIDNPAEWLNRHASDGKLYMHFLAYGLVFGPDKKWYAVKPDVKCEDGYYTFAPMHTGGVIGYLFDKNGHYADGMYIGVKEAKRNSYDRSLMISDGANKNLNYYSVRHTFADLANAAKGEGEFERHSLTNKLRSIYVYEADGTYYVAEKMPRRLIGEKLKIIDPGRNNKWDGDPIFLFDGDAKTYFGVVKLEGNKFEKDKINNLSKHFHLSKDLALFLDLMAVASGTGPKFKESALYKLGVRGPGKGEWFSLLDEEVMSVGALKVWRGANRVTVTHDTHGVIVVGKKTKDGTFVTSENMNLPPEIQAAYSTTLSPLFDAMKGKI